jgi:tetratricopeptide (TPR) repeat protein
VRLPRGWCAVALACAAAGCASRPELGRFDLEGWKALRAGSVEIVGDAPEADLRRLAADLAFFVAVVRETTNAPTAADRLPTRIFLLRNDALRRLRLTGYGGFMARRLDGYLGMVRLEGGHTAAYREILFHEYTHFLLGRGPAVDYPLWYNEGFADLLSTVRHREGLIDVGVAPSARAIEFARHRRFDLATIFGPATYADVGDLHAFYAGAWATVHYLSATEERGAQLERFLELVVSGVGWREAYAQAFDVPLAELSRRVWAHGVALAGGAPFSLAILDARALAVEGGGELRELRPAEAGAALGDFWSRLADDEDDDQAFANARAFFERSLAIEPEDARTRAGLALCRAREGDFARARADAARALAVAPGDGRVQALAAEIEATRARRLAEAGDAAAAEEARRAARAAFLRATELAPGDPVAWAGVGASFVGAEGELGPGIAALERSLELGAWAAGPNLDLARLYAAAGQRERARERLEAVARMDEGRAGERAAELLAELAASERGESAAAR